MNSEHAVDIYLERHSKLIHIERRRDSMLLTLEGEVTPSFLGAAISEALSPKYSNQFAWVSFGPFYPFPQEEADTVTVHRRDGQVFVGTPVCEWGQAPTIALPTHPKHAELGEAVLLQASYPYRQGLI